MKLRNILVGFAVASLLSGCGVFERKQVDLKAGAARVPPLEVPPDLTAPQTEPRYTIPGTDGEKVASFSEYTKKKEEQPCVAPASAPAAAPVAQTPSAKLQEINGAKSILLNEPFDRSWRRVGLALDRAKLVVSDKDRSKGIFFVSAGPKGGKEKRPDYQIVVREVNGNCDVTAVDQNGKPDSESAHLLEVVYENLDKNDHGDLRRSPRGDAVRAPR